MQRDFVQTLRKLACQHMTYWQWASIRIFGKAGVIMLKKFVIIITHGISFQAHMRTWTLLCFCALVVKIVATDAPNFLTCPSLKCSSGFVSGQLKKSTYLCFQHFPSKILFCNISTLNSCFFVFFFPPSGTVFSLGMREWLLWWSQIQGCSVCLTRGDRAWNSRINSMCRCQTESSPTLLRWDNFLASCDLVLSTDLLFYNPCGVYVQRAAWPSLATTRFKFVPRVRSCPTRLPFSLPLAALQSTSAVGG